MGINEINDYINGIDITSDDSGELKGVLLESTQKCKTLLSKIDELNCLMPKPDNKTNEAEQSFLDMAINELKDKMCILKQDLNAVHGHVEDLNRQIQNKQQCNTFVIIFCTFISHCVS